MSDEIDRSGFRSVGAVCMAAGITDLAWYYALPEPKRTQVDDHANIFAVAIGSYLKDLDRTLIAECVDQARRLYGV